MCFLPFIYCIMSNGKYYEGNFKGGKYHGIGTITHEDESDSYE